MDAATFLRGKRTPLSEGAESANSVIPPGGPAASGAPSESGANAGVDPESSSENDSSSAPLVFSDTTPSGIIVEYEAKPKRLYRVNGVEVPSVTTVLNVMAKDGLSWWGMQQGVSGVLELFSRDKLATVIDWQTDKQKPVVVEGLEHVDATMENIVATLTAEKLTVNHQLTKAGDRGTNVHAALESWARSGGEFFPTPQNFPVEERPYVEALCDWIQNGIDGVGGGIKPALCEVMVGSAEHGFAGRYDLVIELDESCEFIEKAYKKRKPKMIVVGPGRYLVDCKTSSGVYSSHFRQLAGYELASVEGGYAPTDGQFVLHLTKDGQYEFVPSNATGDDFLCALALWQSEQRLKGKS